MDIYSAVRIPLVLERNISKIIIVVIIIINTIIIIIMLSRSLRRALPYSLLVRSFHDAGLAPCN